MAERTVTFADLRSFTRLPNTGVFEAACREEGLDHPLITPLRVMADDIATWFDPSQGWKLVEVGFSFIKPSRMREDLRAFEEKIAPKTESRIKPLSKAEVPPTSGKPEIDYLDLVFHFDAENPPLTPARRKLDLARIFSPNFKGTRREIRKKEGNVFVYPERVGLVYPLDQAQSELTSPYFLLTGRARVTSVVNRLWDFGSRHGEYDPKRSIAVLVFTEDLGDYLRAQGSQTEPIEQFDQKFPNTPVDQLASLLKN